ncbi:hypothetical protein ABT294_26720 [Nonomuraea sp. NPDC000554]|uniref:hypothetical protein n=1 Tax=Nonomuraea sp. NPDC000554 TaxID=3154259 RepID=UPI003320D6FE
MSAPRLISCALALAALTASTVACTSTVPGPTGGEPVARGVAGGPVSNPSGTSADPSATAPAALTADAYKSELSGRHKTMLDALNSMAGARTVKTLNQRLGTAEQALESSADELAALSPPQEVKTQHDAYVTSLRDLASSLGSSAGKVGSRALCTSSAVLTDLNGQLKALDQAGEALQGAGGFPADVVTVKAKGKQNRRLGNGHYLRKDTLNGRSSLQIDNGGSRDAVVTVVKGGSKAFSVYVRKKSKFKVRGVRDGTYKIFFTHGVDWDGKSSSFTRDCSFERFQKSVKFKTTYTATQILWHDWRITLHAISGGNAKTSDVDPEQFPG